MKYLIFEHSYKGHILEYIRHQYLYAGNNLSDHTIVFILHPKIKNRWDLLNWPEFSHITIDYIPQPEIQKIESASKYIRSWWLSKSLRNFIDQYKPDKIVVDEIVSFMPFWALKAKRDSISGIMYRIPRHRIYNHGIKHFIDYMIVQMMAKSAAINRVWLLNDHNTPRIYNAEYHTTKFECLPDPINTELLTTIQLPELPKSFRNKTIFLHAGGMGSRKGTFIILDAIKQMTNNELQKCGFIFAGSLSNPSERNQMLSFIQDYQQNLPLLYLDRFLPYELLSGYFSLADYVLIPYKNTEQSSGILGHSAYFNKPVIGPKEGLLGELIANENLGVTIENLDSKKLKDTIIHLTNPSMKEKPLYNSSGYVQRNTIDEFAKKIFQI